MTTFKIPQTQRGFIQYVVIGIVLILAAGAFVLLQSRKSASPAPQELTAQVLTPTPTPTPTPGPGSTVTLKNVKSGLCVSTNGTNGNLIQQACSSSTNQQFTLKTTPQTGYLYFCNVASQYCWDMAGGGGSAGTLVSQYTLTAVWPEYFQLTLLNPGVYKIISGNSSGLCVEIVGASTVSGANLDINTCNGVSNQAFQVSVVGAAPTPTPTYTYSQSAYYAYSQAAYYTYSQSTYYAYSQATYYVYSQSTYYAYSQATYTGTTINVKNSPYNAKGDGVTDDTTSINNAIAALQPGYTLLFPSGTYRVTGTLNINVLNITMDGSNKTATISLQASTAGIHFGSASCIGCSLGTKAALSVTSNELSTSFTTTASIGASAGSYVFLEEAGTDSSNGSNNLQCDVSGCRGEVLKIASVSGNTYTVTTALHDTYAPTAGVTMPAGFGGSCSATSGSGNCATAFLVNNPLTGITLQNIAIDGTNVANTPVSFFGVVNSTVSGVTITRSNSPESSGSYSMLANVTFGMSFTNVTLTSGTASRAQLGIYQHGNVSINGLTLSGSSGAAAFFSAGANANVTGLSVDDAYVTRPYNGRPFKTTSTRYSNFNGLTVKNGSGAFNGVSIEYYSSHNTFNSCVVQNNAASNGSGGAGINSFGNFNQYNTFSGCTISGNGNVQVLINNFDALRLGQDSNTMIKNSTIGGPGVGMEITAANTCINGNTFTTGSGLSTGITISGSNNKGSGNILNGASSNLAAGVCP